MTRPLIGSCVIRTSSLIDLKSFSIVCGRLGQPGRSCVVMAIDGKCAAEWANGSSIIIAIPSRAMSNADIRHALDIRPTKLKDCVTKFYQKNASSDRKQNSWSGKSVFDCEKEHNKIFTPLEYFYGAPAEAAPWVAHKCAASQFVRSIECRPAEAMRGWCGESMTSMCEYTHGDRACHADDPWRCELG